MLKSGVEQLPNGEFQVKKDPLDIEDIKALATQMKGTIEEANKRMDHIMEELGEPPAGCDF